MTKLTTYTVYASRCSVFIKIKIMALACLLAAPWVQLSVSAGNGWPHNALRHNWLMPISCHFRDCKALLVKRLTRVSGAITIVQIFTFTFYRHFLVSGLDHRTMIVTA